MRVLLALGRHNYGQPRRGLGTEFLAFEAALRALGHEPVHFESWDRGAWRDFAELNAALVERVEREQPDALVLVPLLYEIWLDTLDLIRARSRCAVIVWTTDDSWKYPKSSRFYGRHCDLITTTYASRLADYAADGIDHVLLTQWAASSAWLRAPRPANECDIDVSFVGAAHGERRACIEALRRAGLAAQCFGEGWAEGPITAQQVQDVFNRSRISLNFANSYGVNQIKARTFEVPGAGGFLLTEHAEGLDACYREGEEIMVFRDITEAIEKIRWVLAHPEERDRIARAGYQRTVAEHTYEARWRTILAAALENAANRSPTLSAGAATSRLSHLISAHRGGTAARALIRIASWPFVWMWGQARGRRAARRALFELSLRLAGERVFRAGGWPGRFFYRES